MRTMLIRLQHLPRFGKSYGMRNKDSWIGRPSRRLVTESLGHPAMRVYIFKCRARPKIYGATRFETASNLPVDRCSGGWEFYEQVELGVRGTLRFAIEVSTLRREVQKNGWYVWDESPRDLRREGSILPRREQQRPPARSENATEIATAPLRKNFCPTKILLLAAWQDAAEMYSKAVAELSRQIGVLSRANYERLKEVAESALKRSLASQSALETHIADHGCEETASQQHVRSVAIPI